MILPEKEAKEKICVDLLYLEAMSNSFSSTSVSATSKTNRCLGSLCMAWKWHQDYKGHGCCGKVYPGIYPFPKPRGEQ